MPTHFASQIAAVFLIFCACSDDRTADVTTFTLHECKRSGVTGALLTGREASDYAGFECVAWRFEGSHAKIDLINRIEGCGFDGNDPDEAKTIWTPTLVQTSDDALTYSVSWEVEGASACGTCAHDFSIAAKGLDLDRGTLELTIQTRQCNKDCPWNRDAVSIPAAQSGDGIRCRYLDWNQALSSAATYAGKLGGPARDGACDDGLVATEIHGAEICSRACASDADCNAPLTRCERGVCQLTDPW